MPAAHSPHATHSAHAPHAAASHAATTATAGIATAAVAGALLAACLRIMNLLRGIVALILVEIPMAGKLHLVFGARHRYQRCRQKTRRHWNCRPCCCAQNPRHRLAPF